ncbi:VWA domain-containing protein [Streptomyces tropicalis]|uniref:VWA domain-containing protein n=1 Tax=Streptomyces tropicalis TaxID=3034234 RepID=A0ABT6ABY4_9ACTN|nr:VWA domain-containing protein [Streptomyces tropicalis]MDF3301968.1 VWA domain-containing protein [Streptomyces tropicalis]
MGDGSPVGLGFAVDVDAPADLAHDETRADALVTIRARPAGGPAVQAEAAEILIMDRSLSMAGRGKLDEAKRAVCAAVDTLRDGTLLGIVAGNHRAEVVFPPEGGLARVDAAARDTAKALVAGQIAEGGTAIGQWLACAGRLFASAAGPGTVRHAVLYTDGKDEHEAPEELGAVLEACTDRFVCDARGLGDDWNYAELLRITEALHGGAEAVVTVSDLTGDFTRLMRQAQRIAVARVYLGLRLNGRFRLDFLRQTRPVEAELTARQHRDDEIHVPLGSWSPDEARQYQVSLRFDPASLTVDENLRAARLTVQAEGADGRRAPCSDTVPMVVRRRALPAFGIPRSANLTRVENERELGMAMRACADARQRGDTERADRELRLAIGLAEELGDAARLRLLRAVAVTGPDGRPRVRRDVSRGQMQRLGLESTRTAASPADVFPLPPGDGSLAVSCPRCGTTAAVATARFCEQCGHRFGDAPDSGARPEEPGPGGPPQDAAPDTWPPADARPPAGSADATPPPGGPAAQPSQDAPPPGGPSGAAPPQDGPSDPIAPRDAVPGGGRPAGPTPRDAS